MKQTKNNIRKINILFFFLVSLSAIIFIIIKTIADDNLNMRQVRYQLGSTVNYEFSFYTDSPKFHTKASGYEKYKGMNTENNMNSIVATDMVKMQGYGNYEFKPDTNLFSFIDYCYSKDPATTMACAYRAGTTAENEWNYTKLMNYRDRAINTDFFKHFWQNMSNSCPNFKDYQDDFFFLHYTYPATQKVGINLAMMRNLQNEDESVKEYLTCLTSYIFSITPQAQVNGMTFGKGDVVPFLYYKDRKHADLDVRNDSEALMDIAKYAYVALIEGWCTLPTPYHLWENEYNWLFGNYEPENLDYDLETLHQWYDETYQRYCKDKGRKGNNLLGSTIEHIIESDYSIEQQLEATEYYIRGIFSDLGIETDFKETMARNELMAKYMMEHSNFDNVIKDYNVTIDFMTENLQRGTHEEQNTHTVVTSDFQTLEFPYTMDKRNVNHSDEDGISDGAELGSEKWINITEFVKRTYEDAVRSGQPHKATFEEQVEDIIEKNGAYTDFGGNKVYGSVKWDDKKLKVLYRVYDYKSNPKLNDTDFDGLWDNADTKPIDNKLSGTSTEIGKVEYNQDFRWFYTDNKKYNDELAVMSLIMSNLADGNSVSTDQASGDITTYLKSIGFTNPQNIGEGTDNIYVAKKTIQYYDQKKDVIGVFFGRCDRWLSEVIKHKEEQKVQTNNVPFKESLESYINRIVNKINLLETSDCSYWVAGYDVGGSIASEVASKLVEDGKKVYAYTFGASNTRNEMDTKNEIKNIRNEDDFAVKFITGTKPGQNYGASIFENLMFEYRDLTGSSDYKGNYIFTNYLLYVYDNAQFAGTESEETMIAIFDDYMFNFNRITNQDVINGFADLCMLMNKWADGNRQAHSIKSYYVLAKSPNGFDLLDGDEKKQEHYDKIDKTLSAPSSDSMVSGFSNTDDSLLKIIEKVGVWYVNHVSTHNKSSSSNASNMAVTYFTNKDLTPIDDAGVSLTEIYGEKTILTNRGGESSGKYYYFYPPFKDYETSSSMEYMPNGTNRNYLKHYLGDDCSGFVQGIIYTLSSGNRGQNSSDPNIIGDTTGLWNHNVSANNLVTGAYDTDNAMLRLGWEKYYLDGNTWKQKRLFNNEIQVRTLQNVMGNINYEMSIGFLEPGDILVTKGTIFDTDEEYDNNNQHLKNKGHAEVYIGYDYKNKTYKNVNIGEKSGIQNLGLGTKIGNGKRTFGWGQVKYRFPQIIHFKYIDSEKCFKLMQKTDETKYDTRKYVVIWRKN